MQRGVAGWNGSIWSELSSKLFRIPSIDSVLQRGQTNLLRSKHKLQNVWKHAKSFGSETGSRHCSQWSSVGSLSLSTESLAGGDDPGEPANGERDRYSTWSPNDPIEFARGKDSIDGVGDAIFSYPSSL